jgi:hypothetical protein
MDGGVWHEREHKPVRPLLCARLTVILVCRKNFLIFENNA